MATSEYTRDVLRVVVAQICQTIGWHSIKTTPLEVLTDILSRYIHSLGTSAHRYGEQFGHTEPTITDIDLAFKDLGVNVAELEEYVQYVPPVPCAIQVPKYPIERESHLNMLKPGSREVVTRPVHIHDHLPPMHPQLEEEPPLSVNVTSSEPNISPLSSPKNSLLKRAGESSPVESNSIKKARMTLEEQGLPLREVSSVIMTKSGFLSSALEGRLPEAIRASDWKSYHNDPTEMTGKDATCRSVTEGIRKLAGKKKSKTKPTSSKNTDDDQHAKKLVGVKKTSKLKALKHKAIKMRSPTKEIKKANKHKNAPGMSALISSLPKIPKLNQNKAKSDKIKDGQKCKKLSGDKTKDVCDFGEKLFSKPDKQKLNIFKKISKIKEEKKKVFDEVKTNFRPIEESRQKASVSETIISETQKIKEEHTEEAEVVDVGSPDYDFFSFNGDLSPLEIPCTPRTPDFVFPQKQSDENQQPEKKRKSDSPGSSPKRFRSESFESAYSLLEKPKTPEVELTPEVDPVRREDLMAFNSFQLFPVTPGPGLVPQFENLKLPLQEQAASPEMQIKSSPSPPRSPASLTEAHPVPSPVSAPSPVLDVTTVASPPRGISFDEKKEKEHTKDEKIHMKKKKAKKDKSKSKDKEEKSKHKDKEVNEIIKSSIKVEDKYKHKEKKSKKEKKKDKERGDQEKNEKLIPKLTLKLGNPSPQPAVPEFTPCKLIIKRIELPKEKEEKQYQSPDCRPSKRPVVEHVAPSPKPSTSLSQPRQQVEELPKQPVQIPPETKKPVAFYFDEQGNQVWICPACGGRDDGSPMIGCDSCDAWYHWSCVGIQAPPDANNWFCQICSAKKKDKEKKKKSKKHNKKSSS